MDKVLTNDMTKLLLIFFGSSLALFFFLSRWISKIKGGFKQYRSKTFLYVGAAFLLFAGAALLAALPGLVSSPGLFFIFFQTYFLLLGIWHVRAMRSHWQWTGGQGTVGTELLFTLIVAVFGCIGFFLLYRYLNKDGLQYIMAASILFFFIPYFVYHTFKKAMEIPPKLLKQWVYPVHKEVGEPNEEDMINLSVIAFEFRKQLNTPYYTNFRARAPKDMQFGQLFYYFINDYNERHPQGKIQFVNGSGEPFGWVFYKKPRWYSLFPRYIDAEETTFSNRIKENDIIICSRRWEYEQPVNESKNTKP